MTSLIRRDKRYRLITLLDLRGKLRFMGWDELDLRYLDLLRLEVEERIKEITTATSKQQKQD